MVAHTGGCCLNGLPSSLPSCPAHSAKQCMLMPSGDLTTCMLTVLAKYTVLHALGLGDRVPKRVCWLHLHLVPDKDQPCEYNAVCVMNHLPASTGWLTGHVLNIRAWNYPLTSIDVYTMLFTGHVPKR